MMDKSHWKKLENLFLGANIQQMYPGISIQISANEACITWPVESGHFHGGNALHGAAYFKLLDDAAYFAAASIHTTSFLVTGTYSIKYIKPVYSGVITAKGVLAEPSGKYFKSSSRLFNETGELLAEGSGIFIPTTTLWSSLKAYHM